jgi:putative transposase
MQNGYVESLNDTLRDECLNQEVFGNLAQARVALAAWRADYNQIRPHSSLGRVPPAAFAQAWRTEQQAKAAVNPVGTTQLPTAQGCGQAAAPLPALTPLGS